MGLGVDTSNQSFCCYLGDALILRYRAATTASKPHFDIVNVPPGAREGEAGQNLVLAAPHDHMWHLGLFFCPTFIDGINCWESEKLERNGIYHGRAEHVRIEPMRSDPDIATFRHESVWVASDGDKLLSDRREISICTSASRSDGYFLCWDQTLEAMGGRRRLSSESRYGHFSGLCYRSARSMSKGRILLPDEVNPPTDSGPSGRWCDLSGGLDGSLEYLNPYHGGITMMHHPENPPETTRWFTMREPFAFIGLNPTYQQVMTLSPGEPVHWRWGLWVHAGQPEQSEIEAAYSEYVAIAAKL